MQCKTLALALAALAGMAASPPARGEEEAPAGLPLWQMYKNTLRQARYVDLTHAFDPGSPVWPGFGHTRFRPALAGADLPGLAEQGHSFTYAAHGFVATAYDLPTAPLARDTNGVLVPTQP